MNAGVLSALDAEIAMMLERGVAKGSPRHKAMLGVRVTVAELIGPQTGEDLGEIRAAMEKAHSVCTGIVKKSPGVGPIYSHANTAAWQLTNALNRLARMETAVARAAGVKS